jgi:thymidylate kinase
MALDFAEEIAEEVELTAEQVPMPWYVSIEGVRGVGKSTLYLQLLEDQGFPVIRNRELRQQLHTDEDGHRAKELRKEWSMLYEADGDTVEALEMLVWERFGLMLNHIAFRNTQMNAALGESSELLIRDRYLDTSVVYDAVDIILSNPEKYSDAEDYISLLERMWSQAILICDLPPLTILLQTNQPEFMLQRSCVNKIAQARGKSFSLDDYQRDSQELANFLYPISFAIRTRLAPEHRVNIIDVDGLKPLPVLEKVLKLLNTEYADEIY